MAAMIQTTPRVPSMSSTESEYHRFNLHRLTEASSKLGYGNNDPSPYAPDRQTYYQDSAPDLDSEDMNNGGFFSGISDNRFEGLQLPSQVESSLDQLQSYVAQSPVTQAKNSIFGGVSFHFLGLSIKSSLKQLRKYTQLLCQIGKKK